MLALLFHLYFVPTAQAVAGVISSTHTKTSQPKPVSHPDIFLPANDSNSINLQFEASKTLFGRSAKTSASKTLVDSTAEAEIVPLERANI